MKRYDFSRVVSFISFGLSVLVIALGLNSVQAATYEGQWTKIILDKVNAASLDLKGTVKVTGPDLTPKNYNLPATISATRLASLAKGFLRGGVYGIVINEAMVSAGWLWSDILKNWYKPGIDEGPVVCNSLPEYPGNEACPTGNYRVGSGSQCVAYSYLAAPPHTMKCPAPPAGYHALVWCMAQGLKYNCSGGANLDSYDTLYRKPIDLTYDPPPTPDTVATDDDIFKDGVKPNSTTIIPDLITGLPQVIGTPTEQLKPPSLPSIYWPEIVLDIINFINNLNFTQNLFDIVNQSFTDLSSLTQTQINTLVNSGIDIQTLINAINNTINNTTLTTEEKNQLNLWNNLQTSTTTPPVIVPPEPLPITIPTDCELIPFVCDWLEWYRGWLTEEPPPIPESVIPIEEPDFDLWPTATEGSCPPPYQFSVFGQSVEVSYQPWCDLAILIAPLLMALGWLFASYIILRVR